MTMPAAPPEQPTFWELLYHHMQGFTGAAAHFLPRLEAIAASPRLDELVEAALNADRLGVAGEVFDAVTDSLRAAADRKAGPLRATAEASARQAAPSFTPVTDGAAQSLLGEDGAQAQGAM